MTGPLAPDVRERRAASIAAAAKAKNETLINEIERLLTFGEGEYAITRASGYTPDNLKRQLTRLGRNDLIPRIFEYAALYRETSNR